MTDEKNFEQRPDPELRQAWDDYKGGMRAIGKKLTLKQWVIGLLGIYVAIHLLVNSNNAGAKVAAAAANASSAVSVQTDTPAKPKCEATLKEYNGATIGMAEREVAALIGCPGTEISRVSDGGKDSVMVSWPGSWFLSSMNATFDGDQLVAKGQMGLE